MRGIEQYLQVDAATLGALKYAGTWNASTNTPTLASGVGTQGQYYVVSVAGSTNLDGETNWQVGDWAVFNGSVWQKVDGGSTGLLSTLTVTGNTFLATTSGNVGIGTTSPAYKLDIGGINPRIRINETTGYVLTSYSNTGGSFDVGRDNSAGLVSGAAYAGFLNVGGAYPLIFNTNSAERMRITSTGDVGIGTSSPTAKLEVYDGTTGELRITNATQGFQIYTQTGATTLGTYTNIPLAIRTNAVERMRITSTGNVGIGTSSPVNTTGYGGLTLNGTSGAIVSMMENGTETFRLTNATGYSFVNTTGSTPLLFGTAAIERMRITSAGDVGIGTSTPAVKLDVANGFAIIGANSANPGIGGNIRFRDDTGTARWLNGILGSVAATAYSIYDIVAGAERLSITSTGNVGIGTSSPNAKLEANAAVTFTNIDTFGQFVVKAAAGATGYLLNFGVDPTNTHSFIQSVNRGTNAAPLVLQRYGGDVGIGTSSPGEKLQVAGAIRATGAVAANTTGGILAYQGSSTIMLGSWGADASTYGAIQFYQANSTGTINRTGMLLDASGNLGLGVTPSAWSTGSSIEVGNPYAKISSSGTYGGVFTNNAYYNAGWKYNVANYATMYQTAGGIHSWHTAPSGTAGAAVSFTQAMTLDASGNLLVGSTSGPYSAANRGYINISGSTDSVLGLSNGASARGYLQGTATAVTLGATTGSSITFDINGERLRITSAGNIHTPAGATTMTNGFFYIPAAAGVPTGVPTAITGTVPMYYDTTNNKFYVYNGAWKSVTLT